MDLKKIAIKSEMDILLSKNIDKRIKDAVYSNTYQLNADIRNILKNTLEVADALKSMLSNFEADDIDVRRYLLDYSVNQPKFSGLNAESVVLERFIDDFVHDFVDFYVGKPVKSDKQKAFESEALQKVLDDKDGRQTDLYRDLKNSFDLSHDIDLAIQKARARTDLRGYAATYSDCAKTRGIERLDYQDDLKILDEIQTIYAELVRGSEGEFKYLYSEPLIGESENNERNAKYVFKETNAKLKMNESIMDMIDKFKDQYPVNRSTVDHLTYNCFGQKVLPSKKVSEIIGCKINELPFPMPDDEKAQAIKMMAVILRKSHDMRSKEPDMALSV